MSFKPDIYSCHLRAPACKSGHEMNVQPFTHCQESANPAVPTAAWLCRLRRAYSVNDTKQLPEWTDSAQGLATPFGKAMREAHDRRSQSSVPHMMPQQEQDQPEEAQPGASSPRSPGRRSPSKSMSEYASPRSSIAQPAGRSSAWVGVMP